MRLGRIECRLHVLALAAGEAERGDRGGRIAPQPVGEGGIAPGTRDDLRAVTRADLGLVGVDDDVDRGGVDQPLPDEDRLQRANPRVGLLNVGEEPEKGNELAVETYRLLENSGLNFVGNIEGRDIVVGGACDVLVTDGFAGNVLLKFYESVAGLMVKLIRKELAAQQANVHLDGVFKLLDYTEYGGAPLLGVNGISIICHGGSNARAITSALRLTVRAYENDMVGDMKRVLSEAHAAEGAGTGGTA